MADTTTNASTIESSSSSQDSYSPNDPLFLHPGENLGAILTSQPLIGGENYPAWARLVRKSLIVKNKLGFIDGSLTIFSPLVDLLTAVQDGFVLTTWMALGSSIRFHQSSKLVSYTEIQYLRSGLISRTHLAKGMDLKSSIFRSKLLSFIRENNHSLITSLSLRSCGIRFRISVHFLNALVESVCATLIKGYQIFKLKSPQWSSSWEWMMSSLKYEHRYY